MKFALTGFILLCHLGCLTLYAQFPQLHFENITTAQGLSNNEVTCFYQDRQGFLWVGTKYGLNRYDGKVFQTFFHDPNNSNSLSGNHIVDILQDKEGVFWIATKDGGLTRYDPSQQKSYQFRQFLNNPNDSTSIPTNRLNCLFDYNDEYLLAGAEVYTILFIHKKNFSISYWESSVNFYYNTNELFKPSKSGSPSKFKNWVHKIKAKEDTVYMSLLAPPNIYMIVHDSVKALPLKYSQKGNPLTAPDFCVDGNRIWQANWSPGLFVQTKMFVPDSNITYTSIEKFSDIDDVVTHVENYNSQFLILTTASKGIYLVDKITGDKTSFAHKNSDLHSLASNKGTALFKDRQGTWWIGTSGGISKFNPLQWQFSSMAVLDDPDHDFTVFSVNEDSAGIIRICTSDGIYKKSPSEKNFRLIQYSFRGEKVQPTMVLNTDSGYILGTENSFFNYDPDVEHISPFSTQGETHLAIRRNLYEYGMFQIRSLVMDTLNGHRVLWFAPLGWGLGFYDFEKKLHDILLTVDSIPSSIGNNLSRKVIFDQQRNLWVGTSQGLYRWRRNNQFLNDFDAFVHIPGNASSLSSNDITDIYVDENNHLWITTNGGGLNEYDGNKFRTYLAALPQSNSMYGVYPDHSDRFWIPTTSGFEVFDRKTKKFRHMEVTNSAWLLKLPARIFQNQGGEFLYGAGNNFVSFHPDSVSFDDAFPKIYLSDFHLFNQSDWWNVRQGSLDYAYNKNYFTIFYSALQLSQPATVHYQYLLEGLDQLWNDGGHEGKVSYTNLPPGSYTFKARVTNSFGAWSEPVNLVSFTVKPPFWYCWWFYVICVIAVTGIVYLISTFRVRHLLKIQNIRNRIANDLHDDVGSALSTISLYSEVARMKATDDNHGLNEILEKITETSQEMQESMSYIVWSIQPRNDHFDQIVQRMKQYAVDILQMKNITVQFELDEKLQTLKLPPEKRRELFLIFKEAIHNVTKYAHCSEVYILFRKEEGNLIMEITDNGVGFKQDQAVAGNGLFTMNDRAKSLRGKLQIRSKMQQGTTVELQFPV